MTTFLLQINIGPIQDFILQARRTRDLWFGSHLLSELSRCVARTLATHSGVQLIFPALDQTNPELAACIDQPFRDNGNAPLSVANIILATVEAENETAVEVLTAKARDTLSHFWCECIAKPIKDSLLAYG